MALERFFRLPSARQQQIIDAAAEAFARNGYDGTSYNELLATLGLSKSQAYYYFADKADLFATACARCYADYFEEAGRLPTPTDAAEFWRQAHSLWRLGLEFHQTHPLALQLGRALATSPLRRDLGRSAALKAPGTQGHYRDWLALGQRLQAVRTDLPLDLLAGLCLGISVEVDVWFADRGADYEPANVDSLAARLTEFMRGAFAPRDESERPRKGSGVPSGDAPTRRFRASSARTQKPTGKAANARPIRRSH